MSWQQILKFNIGERAEQYQQENLDTMLEQFMGMFEEKINAQVQNNPYQDKHLVRMNPLKGRSMKNMVGGEKRFQDALNSKFGPDWSAKVVRKLPLMVIEFSKNRQTEEANSQSAGSWDGRTQAQSSEEIPWEENMVQVGQQ
jgi:uncharacterized protein (DUF1919 family)